MTAIPIEALVTVFGGSGFLGRHVVRALAKRGYRVRVAVRRPDLAGHLQPLGRVGQIHAVQANLRYAPSVHAAARDADIVVNLVGILLERGRQRFDAVQGAGAEAVALATHRDSRRWMVEALGAREEGIRRGLGRHGEDFVSYVWTPQDVLQQSKPWPGQQYCDRPGADPGATADRQPERHPSTEYRRPAS